LNAEVLEYWILIQTQLTSCHCQNRDSETILNQVQDRARNDMMFFVMLNSFQHLI